MQATKIASTLLVVEEDAPLIIKKSKKPRPFILLLIILAVFIVLHLIAYTHTAAPTIKIHNCLDIIRYNDYNRFDIATQSNEKIGNVQLVDQIIAGKQAVVVPVIDASSQQIRDLYVYSCSIHDNQPELALRFKKQNLVNGLFSVTQADTMNVSELDPHLTPDSSSATPFQQTVNREYLWQNGAFVQATFPGLYPVLSRVEAEDLQTQFNQGHPFPWSDPIVTTTHMVQDLLHWNTSKLSITLIDQAQSVAHVLLTQSSPHFVVQVTLQRLVQPDENGLWFVTQAQTAGISVDTFPLQKPISSPTLIHGIAKPEAADNTLQLFDHTLSPLVTLIPPTLRSQADNTFTGQIFYTNNIANQPGLLLIERTPREKQDGQQHNDTNGQLLLTSIILD